MIKLFAGTSNPALARAVCDELSLSLSQCRIERFADGECFIEVLENVRGTDTFVLQSTSRPADESLLELLIFIDALRRGSANSITAVLPYFGYARQDRKTGPRTPITARLVANMIETAGATRVLTVELHAGQIQGFFDVPTDNLFSTPVFSRDLKEKLGDSACPVVVSPDIGGVVRARLLAERLGGDIAIIDKRRPRPNVSEVMHVIGSVEGRDCVLVDDIVDSAGTLCNAADALFKQKALSVRAYATHGVLSGPASERIERSKLDELVITDTIATSREVQACGKIRVLSLAPLLGEAIRSISEKTSISRLFD